MINTMRIAMRVAGESTQADQIRNQLICFFALLPALLFSGHAQAVEPPANIRLEQNVLMWDAVDSVSKFDIYLLTNLGPNANGDYVATVVDANEYTLSSPGIYTVVSATDNGEYSTLDSSGRAVFDVDNNESETVADNPVSEIRTQRCVNAVAGETCTAQCRTQAGYSATGGACRADTGTVIHHRALQAAFQCIVQNDTFFVETDIYCRRP